MDNSKRLQMAAMRIKLFGTVSFAAFVMAIIAAAVLAIGSIAAPQSQFMIVYTGPILGVLFFLAIVIVILTAIRFACVFSYNKLVKEINKK